MTVAPATRRINRGKGHSYLLDGAPVDGVTRCLSEGYPKPALFDWAGRVAAGYAVDHWAELTELGSSERLRRIEKARYELTSQATVRGTAVHELAQRLQSGEEIDVPEPLIGHVDAYLRFVQEWQPRELFVEAPVFNREFSYAGTVDLVADLNDDHRWLLDWKTSKGEPWPEVALQLAAYRYAEFALVDGTEHPMPRIDKTGVVWLRADGYDLVEIQAGPTAFEAFGAVQAVAQFRAEPREHWIGQMLEPPHPLIAQER
jgi:hypothetical protein